MLEKIIDLDKQLLVFLNGLGSERFDPFWMFITEQKNWIPFFLLLLYLVYQKLGVKQTLVIILFVAALLTLNNQITEEFKQYFLRLRPCNDPEIKDIIRNIKPSATFSFFSGHSSNTMAVFVFLYFIFRKQYNYFGLLILWPFVFAYSRIYLGLHFPTDILCGFTCGIIMGFLTYKLYQILQIRYFKVNF
ncbi:phosphatase PAP2 family protein [Flavobacterium sp.]|uniref:phosphatase PAP2 family protein n=1 Tax=Flavobacterium sp. TaxID=239 RepID=UPI00286E9F6A|nr:phosphatase PAP2 family protein [Flavobacterium sp.]